MNIFTEWNQDDIDMDPPLSTPGTRKKAPEIHPCSPFSFFFSYQDKAIKENEA